MFIYPKLPAVKTFSFFRVGGNGLANCMFIAARAAVKSKKYNLKFIEPTWLNISLGTYIRGQKDKRHYIGLFNNYRNLSGLRKAALLLTKKKFYDENKIEKTEDNSSIYIEEGLGNYFQDIIDDYSDVADYFNNIIKKEVLQVIENKDFSQSIAVHIRLGDYSEALRIPISWYRDAINYINECTDNKYEILIFSDGSLTELEEILKIPNAKFFFGGNALADIISISKCKFLLGSDSTFSGWGAYLGQVPCIFSRKHYGRILSNQNNELITDDVSKNIKAQTLIKKILVDKI
ncbi:hypothetical protein IX39_06770 [Chryseobacterium formosense]|uniref:Glycosyl transferase family 11 n=1 Tax=Chryseobacterium formosense TaxID=236814 RepID=A0A085Z7E0_9FLAO|nr:alpha-1,2-fucosyltransferase [Chryseobacterium formosense]KFF00354.1 hypothetical protein IX39_06770 [Chryseobacterium formosense]SFT33147.1 Glycosyl transferase family 11 [Chryseobacterium formosense]